MRTPEDRDEQPPDSVTSLALFGAMMLVGGLLLAGLAARFDLGPVYGALFLGLATVATVAAVTYLARRRR